MNIVQHPSPNHNARPAGAEIIAVVLHGTAGTIEGDLAWLTDQARDADGKVYDTSLSYHYEVGRDGRVYQLVQEGRRAWHAGDSQFLGMPDVNDFSIGVAFANRGPVGGDPRNPAVEEYTTAQILSGAELLVDIGLRCRIPWRNMVPHSVVSPGRKHDPWGHFPWMELAGGMLSYQRIRV